MLLMMVLKTMGMRTTTLVMMPVLTTVAVTVIMMAIAACVVVAATHCCSCMEVIVLRLAGSPGPVSAAPVKVVSGIAIAGTIEPAFAYIVIILELS